MSRRRRTTIGLAGCLVACACAPLLELDKFTFKGGTGGTASSAGGTTLLGSAATLGGGGIGGRLGLNETGPGSGGADVSGTAGGRATGGAATGGAATGGAATGGAATGGASNTDPTRCPSPMVWHDLQDYATSADRTVPATALAGGVAVVSEAGTVRCPAARISDFMLLTVDCAPNDQEAPTFGSWKTDAVGNAPLQVSQCSEICPSEFGSRFNLHCACTQLDRNLYPLVSWSRRHLRPGELLSLIAFDPQGNAIAAKARAPSFDIFASPTGASTDPAKVTLVFGEDSQLIGYCGRGSACGNLVGCTSIDSIINDSHFELHWRYTVQNAFFADISGDGRADAVTAFPHAMFTAGQLTDPLTGLLGPSKTWCVDTVGGDDLTFLADINGDHRSDLLSVSVAGRHLPSNSTIVSLSAGTNFARIAAYYSGDLKGTSDLYWGDVDGLAGDELVTIGDGVVMVYRASGIVFLDPEAWGTYDNSTKPVGAAIADVTGDGKADVIIIRDTQLQVMPSTGTGFGPPSVWLDNVTPGAPGWFFAKLHDATRADAILIDSNGSTVYLTGADGFAKSPSSYAAIPIGERGNYFADVTGDGLDDAIVLNHQSAWVYPSAGNDFGAPILWYDKPLYGGL